MSRLIILLTFLFSSSVVNAAPIEILCRIKGTGQRTFVLDSGFWSSSVMFKAGSGKLTEWCKENADQSVKFGKKKAMCNFSGIRRGGMLIWGTTTVDFQKPSWMMRYRFAKPNQTYKDSAPGGRELATCVHKK